MVKNWSKIGQTLVKNWSKTDQKLIKNWSKIGQKLVKNWSKIGQKLAIAKPGLMEIRFNKGTEEVIKEIENDTKNISDLGNDSSD